MTTFLSAGELGSLLGDHVVLLLVELPPVGELTTQLLQLDNLVNMGNLNNLDNI